MVHSAGSSSAPNVQHDESDLDYPNAVDYVKAHEERGDAVIAVGPANLTGYSLGHAPTYWVSANRTQTLLYVFEKDNHVVDTEYGIPVLLNAAEFEAAIDAHRRLWLVVSDENSWRFIRPSDRSSRSDSSSCTRGSRYPSSCARTDGTRHSTFDRQRHWVARRGRSRRRRGGHRGSPPQAPVLGPRLLGRPGAHTTTTTTTTRRRHSPSRAGPGPRRGGYDR